MKEQVLTITASASVASLVITTPSLSSAPSMISASTRFLAQPRETKPILMGRSVGRAFINERPVYGPGSGQAMSGQPHRLDTFGGGAFVPVAGTGVSGTIPNFERNTARS